MQSERRCIGDRYTWSQGERLVELSDAKKIDQIKANYGKAMAREKEAQPNRSLLEVMGDVLDDEDDEDACLICQK